MCWVKRWGRAHENANALGLLSRWMSVLIFLCVIISAESAFAQGLPKISLQVEDAQEGEMQPFRCKSFFF